MHSNTLHNAKRNKSRNAAPNKTRNVVLPSQPIHVRRPCANRVRVMLLRHGLSYAEVARRLGVANRSTIARVVYGHYIKPDIRAGIAEMLGVTTEQLWPASKAA